MMMEVAASVCLLMSHQRRLVWRDRQAATRVSILSPPQSSINQRAVYPPAQCCRYMPASQQTPDREVGTCLLPGGRASLCLFA